LKNIICKLASGETVELRVRKAIALIMAGEAIALDFGSEAGEVKQPETMEGPSVSRRGRPRKEAL